jgi:hypothetical protein
MPQKHTIHKVFKHWRKCACGMEFQTVRAIKCEYCQTNEYNARKAKLKKLAKEHYDQKLSIA